MAHQSLLDDRAHAHESDFGEELRRVRVLVRLDQGRRDRRVPAARGRLRRRPLARCRTEPREPHGAWRLRPERHLADFDRSGGGNGLLLRRRDRHDCGGRGRRTREGRGQGDELGDHARAAVLRRFDPARRLSRALEFAGDHDALRQRARRDGHSRGRADHERGRAHRGALGTQFGALCFFAHAVCADAARRCADRPRETEPQRRADRARFCSAPSSGMAPS